VSEKLPELPKPTAAELEILGVLWHTGPATVRSVHEVLEARKGAGYTTVLKTMQIMADKGLLEREESAKAHVYTPVLRQEDTQRQLVDDLLEKVFGGSASQLVMRALSGRRTSKKEMAEIRRMLDEYEGGKR
jgi:BlaI family transcriptional regulator, penicillinase repressor